MAETVKKSRIVSDDDNLEESLLEEFNMRLKNCMSEDKIAEPEAEAEQIMENSLYENVETLKIVEKSDDFIQAEIESYYDVPRPLNGIKVDVKDGVENQVYAQPEKTESNDQNQLVRPEIALEDYEEIEHNYETIDEDLPTLNLPSTSVESDTTDHDGKSSVKDRMFLSTDDASCLLFTQTVTSPMLTPSEENIDFLKGFRRESTNTNSPDTSPKNDAEPEVIYENLPNGEAIYENIKPESIYQNVEELKQDSPNKNRDSLKEFEKIERDLELVLSETNDVEEVIEVTEPLEDIKEESETIQKEIQTLEETVASVNTTTTTKSEVKEKYSEFIHHNRIETSQNYLEKYSEVITKNTRNIENKEKDTESVPDKIVANLKSQFSKTGNAETIAKKEFADVNKLKKIDIMKQINKFEKHDNGDSTVTESYSESTTIEEVGQIGEKGLKKKKSKKSRKEEKENISVKSSFNKFDALQKKNVLHVRSSDAAGAQDKFNGTQIDTTNCKACYKTVFQMEQIKAEKAIWHKNCFRCTECNKQLNFDTYQSNEGNLYCKPHFKSLFAPKVVEEDQNAPSDKPDLGLEELQSLNVKERFQVFEQHQHETYESDSREPVNVKRSPSILSKLARFQAKGMDVGVADDSLNGIPIEESSSDEEVEEEVDGEDADLVRAKKVQKEKPFHFTGMSDVKNRWEKGEQNGKDERREERKQEIQSIRNRLFMGKQGKMKEMYQQAVIESESSTKAKSSEKIDFDAKSIKDRFEKGETLNENQNRDQRDEEEEVYESEISKKSRSLFLELDANASKAPQISPVSPPRVEIKKAREAATPERELYRDPDVVRSEEIVEDTVVAKESHTASKMLNKFRQMEENLSREPTPQGPKPLKRFTPPPEPARSEGNSEDESGSEEESEQEEEVDNSRIPSDLVEAQKAARAKQLRAKFEKWEAQEVRKEQSNSVNIVEEYSEEQSQVESTRSLRARFENMKDSSSEVRTTPRVKVNRFV
ncbi:unnamed protein product [Brassicogethes aeneus]|uniref:LIM zinc-binding domain-containing protein n=1 Tax=Brassicogethes aeneus TaxID=1431903 RepID=A0A9P0AS24_BRAAE|nr:unnamed protein product [Brassicogethes aeneus]